MIRAVSTPWAVVAASLTVLAGGLAGVTAPAAADELPGPPTSLAVTVSNDTLTILFAWRAPLLGGPVSSYIVEAGTAPGASDALRVDTGSESTSYTRPLLPNGVYYARVRARNVSGTGDPSNEVSFTVGCVVPDPPTGLAYRVDRGTVTFSWNRPSFGDPFPHTATRWIIEVGASPGTTAISRDTAAWYTWTTLSGLPATTLYARVRTRNVCGISRPSGEVAFVTGAPPPDAAVVINEFGLLRGGQFIELRNIGRSPVNIGGWRILTSNVDTTNTSKTLPAGVVIGSGCTYLLATRSYSGSVPGDTTFDPEFTYTGGIALARSDGLIVDQVGMEPSSPPAGPLTPYVEGRPLINFFRVYLWPDPSYERRFFDTDDNQTDFRLVRPGTPQNLSTCRPWAPSAPNDLDAVVSGASVTLTWNPPNVGGIPADYIVEAGSYPGGINRTVFATGSDATWLTAVDVPHGTYFVRVRARNEIGVSFPSNEKEFTVCRSSPCFSAPGSPSALQALLTGSTVTLVWNEPSTGGSPESYVIEAGSRAGAVDLAEYDTRSRQTVLVVPGVPPGSYFVRVRGRNVSGISGPSNEVLVVVGASMTAAAPR